MPVQRKIIHVDLDAFYASVEQRDNPSLRGRPLAVGSDSARGVVAAASYEARKFGVRSALPMRMAQERCRELLVVPPRFEVYREVSRQIREVFAIHTDLIESLSLDEAYLDVTSNRLGLTSATAVAEEIRREIKARTGLTASAGVSFNKFLAKMGSGMNKPDGMTVIRPAQAADLVADMEVARFHGIGPATAARMAEYGIRTGRDLRSQSAEFMQSRFGKSAAHYLSIAWGIDDRPVVPDRERKSYGAEDTFDRDVADRARLVEKLDELGDKVWEHRDRIRRDARTVTIKMKYRDFEQITRSKTVKGLVSEREDLRRIAEELLDSVMPLTMPLRLIGISLSNLAGVGEVAPEARQMALL